MSFLFGVRKIDTNLKKTKDVLSFNAVKPGVGDWIFVGIIAVGAIPLAWYTVKSVHYTIALIFFYWVLAYSLIDDTFETIIDKKENSVKVTKWKTGRIKYVRVSPADELINVIHSIINRKG